ncbi:MAG TPA: ABC transporter substrate-binding protein [Novosphingobium sp.]|nr:ABC transporter substrate-binding protein [Novosphingobium sp.]
MLAARHFWLKTVALAGLALAPVLAAPPALAQQADPAAQAVDQLDNGLIAIMHAGAGAGQAGRAARIAPVVDRVFDIALMTRLSVGPGWTNIAPADQQALVAGFRALTISQYAHNFDSFGGERFAVNGPVETRGADKLVRTSLIVPGHDTELLNYRLRADGGQWKIIDVYYRNSISQLATRRAEFAVVLAKGGAKALISHLNQQAASPR